MPFKPFPRFAKLLTLIVMLCFACATVMAQTESAKISGVVTDSSSAIVIGAEVLLTNIEQGTTTTVTSNHSGIYVFPSVRPGQYRISARKTGFKAVDVLGVVVNVQDRLEENFRLEPGSVTESITITGGAPVLNTEDATVSTVVDRNFAENLPLNGRSFQTLIDLTPGVVPVVAGGGNGSDSGQFSVNGQRAASNYWMVDGVSANAASNTGNLGNQLTGATGVTSVFGGTNSLVPVDDMQEFRIQTSTFAPEFGRTPGAQISIVTRSGNNSLHGSAFDYLRNDALDANNWFNGFTNAQPLPKAKERQNDFGGTFGGPILKNRTFFFFSYEGLRLRLPVTALSTVPSLSARQSATPGMQPILNAFPLDPNQPDLGNGMAQFNASFSNPGTLNDYNLRIDHRLTNTLSVFGRYNYSPSTIVSRGSGAQALSALNKSSSVAQQVTSGVAWSASPRVYDEFRFNYSRTDASGSSFLDGFRGAVPFAPTFPSPFNASNSQLGVFVLSLIHFELIAGPFARNVQHQINLVDTATLQLGSHNLKVGADYRRLNPVILPFSYSQSPLFLDVNQAASGSSLFTQLDVRSHSSTLFNNLGVFAQDTWRVAPKLTITYGIRWDVDFAPSASSGPAPLALSNFNPNDLSAATLAPSGTPPFHTGFRDVAPRVGAAYQLSARPDWETVIRGGFGVFYDLATSETANAIANTAYPYSARSFAPGAFPLTGTAAAPPPIIPPTPSAPQLTAAVDPNLKAPYTLQWNTTVEQRLGAEQSLSVGYIGAAGRRLLQTTLAEQTATTKLNPAFAQLLFASNAATSDYHALQIKFERRLARNLQVLSSYTWSHSIDTASAGSGGVASDRGPGQGKSGDRASSDFDVRHSFSLGSTYKLPVLAGNRIERQITKGWSLQSIVQTRSATPLTVSDGLFFRTSTGYSVLIRPDVTPGIPLYLYGSQYPGGKALNPAAFTAPPGVGGCNPALVFPCDALRQGNSGRSSLRAFGMFQWDLGVHREFSIRESLKLEFRAEMFNALNHPNFAPPQVSTTSSDFGRSSQTLDQYLGSGVGNAGLNSIYQIGGPRSMQFALKLMF